VIKALVAMAAICFALVAPAAAGDAMFQGKAIVTGKGPVNRVPGLRQAFEDVLVKASGDAGLIGDKRVAALAERVDDYVAGFSYRDLYEGRQIHDEQGSYDRPHEITVDFKPERITEALNSLGLELWPEPRPHIVVFLAVGKEKLAFVLASVRVDIPDMGFSLAAAAKRIGLDVILPDRASLEEDGIDVRGLATKGLPQLVEPARKAGGDTPLNGLLMWSDKDLGWVSKWAVERDGKPVVWGVRGVGFDEAFRVGVRGAAKVLSGNGRP
jgi:hypothetical protein